MQDYGEFHGLLYDYSEYNLPENPFVSTTKDPAQALRYATRNGKEWRDGYVSILRLHYQRIDDFNQYINLGIAAQNRECGVHGFIHPNEIVAQIPVREIEARLGTEGLEQADLATCLAQLAPEHPFRESASRGLTCPVCNASLPLYLAECLGASSADLSVFPVTDSEATPFIASQMEQWNLNGQLVACTDCRSFIYNAALATRDVVEIVDIEADPDEIRFYLFNGGTQVVETVDVEVEFSSGPNAARRKYAMTSNLRPRPSLLLPELFEAWAEREAEFDKRIGPGEKSLQRIPWASLRMSSTDSAPVRAAAYPKIRLRKVRFHTGRTWSPFPSSDEVRAMRAGAAPG